MTDTELDCRMREARIQIERATQLLLRPAADTLEACGQSLSSAVATLSSCGAECGGRRSNTLQTEASRLRQSLSHAGFLLDTAWRHHARWLAVLRSRAVGYTPCGDPAELASAPRLVLRA